MKPLRVIFVLFFILNSNVKSEPTQSIIDYYYGEFVNKKLDLSPEFVPFDFYDVYENYQLAKFDDVLNFIDTNFNKKELFSSYLGKSAYQNDLLENSMIDVNSISVVEIYINIYKSRNQQSEGISKILNLIETNNIYYMIEDVAIYCLNEKVFSVIDSLYINYKANKDCKGIILIAAASHSLQMHKKKMLDLLDEYFLLPQHIDKNWVMIAPEFREYLNDKEFLELMKEKPKQLKVEMPEINFDSYAKLLDFYKIRRNNLISKQYDSIKAFTPYALKYYPDKLLNLITDEKSNIDYKIQLADLLLDSQDKQLAGLIAKDLLKYNLRDQVGYKLDNLLLEFSKINPKESAPLIRENVFRELKDDLLIDFQNSNPIFKILAKALPYTEQILIDSLSSDNQSISDLCSIMLTLTNNNKYVNILSSKAEKEANSNLREHYYLQLSLIISKESIKSLDRLISIFPSDSEKVELYKSQYYRICSMFAESVYPITNRSMIENIKFAGSEAKEIFKMNFMMNPKYLFRKYMNFIYWNFDEDDIEFFKELAVNSLDVNDYTWDWLRIMKIICLLEHKTFYEF